MVQTLAHNVMTRPVGTVYLNEPMNKATSETEDKTDPQNAPESDEATPAPQSNDGEDEKYKKRYDDLKRHYDNTKSSYESQISDLKTQFAEVKNQLISNTESSFKPPRTQEETKQFMEKYPELSENILSMAMDVVSKSSTVINEKIKQLEEKQNAISSQHGIQELKKFHPDFEQVKDDPRFHEWFNKQPQEVKNLIRSSNPAVIALGLDKYKEFAGIKTAAQKAEDKKNATREVKTPTSRVQIGEPGKRIYSSKEIDKMSMAEFEANKSDIIAAQYEGRIVG